MKLTGETKIFLGILAATAIIIVIAAVVFTKPAPTISRQDLITADAHTRGNAQAKAYLVEVSDFECPACLATKPTVDAVVNQYKDKLLYVYRYFPLSQHPFAQQAAQAAEAAGKQGKFWEMYDVLFANQNNFSDTEFDTLAKQLKLDMTKFDADYASSDTASRITEDVNAGNTFGIDATPTFFLNGKKLDLTSDNDLVNAVKQAVQ